MGSKKMKEVKEVLKDNGWSDLQVEAALYYKHLSFEEEFLGLHCCQDNYIVVYTQCLSLSEVERIANPQGHWLI
jgi:hypothetical protein